MPQISTKNICSNINYFFPNGVSRLRLQGKSKVRNTKVTNIFIRTIFNTIKMLTDSCSYQQ